jgi:3-deoxy-7-phosphoheptulonate synthase
VAGRQDPGDPATLTYGQSVTDACLDIEMTEAALATLAAAVSARRSPPGPRAARTTGPS